MSHRRHIEGHPDRRKSFSDDREFSKFPHKFPLNAYSEKDRRIRRILATVGHFLRRNAHTVLLPRPLNPLSGDAEQRITWGMTLTLYSQEISAAPEALKPDEE